ncbi:MAG: dTDP-4-amino-4,6-dideoxyglucose formyltransferase [Burkholderiales bacterium]
MDKRILVMADNGPLLERLLPFLRLKRQQHAALAIRFSPGNAELATACRAGEEIRPLDIRADWQRVAADYDFVFSLHCRQIFPAALVEAVRCVNLHPGYNPYNRGRYPHVFSLINKMPAGCTLHLMDAQIDHGPILAQQQIEVFPWDTSLTLYQRIVDAEIGLFTAHFDDIVSGRLVPAAAPGDGNLNRKEDFDRLCRIDLTAPTTFGEAIDRLRALTHGEHRNAYFIDENGRKVYVRMTLLPERK